MATFVVTVSATQAQAASAKRAAARIVRASQPQAASAKRAAARIVRASQPRAITLGRAPHRTIKSGQGQIASVGRGLLFIRPSGIASTATVGRPTVTLVGQSIFPAGIAPSGGVGTPTVGGPFAEQFIHPMAWQESELVGAPTVSHTAGEISPPGIAPSGRVGTPIILLSAVPTTTPRNVLIDRVTREIYPWPLNHATEDSVKTLGRRLTRSGISASGKLIQTRKVFLIRQPSHPGPMHLILHGSLIDRNQAQYQTFIRFFNECDNRTFDYIDASGDSYHVAIVQFDARRQMSPARVDGSFFSYSLEAEVIDVNQGAYKGYVV